MKVVLSHPTGNTFVRATARALHQRSWLGAFYTTVAAPAAADLLPAALRRQLARRQFAGIPRELLRTRPWRESMRLAADALGVAALTAPGRPASVDAVYADLDRHVAGALGSAHAGAVDAIYAYEDGAAASFAAARQRGIACVYELPIAHWHLTQRLLREEAQRLPAWRVTLRGIDDDRRKLERKDRELELADTVVVPSRFVLDSLPAHVSAVKRCIVAPFGAPASPGTTRHRPATSRLRVLFAGALSQRKGLADLFAAMRLLNRDDVELVVLGSAVAPLDFYRREYAAFTYEPPRPHDGVLTLMRTCDLLALPSIVEGCALVQQEALASGLPLVVTANAGGDGLVVDGVNGFVVPIRAPEAIAARLAWFADHRDALEQMREEAYCTAAARPWEHYEAAVCEAVAPPERQVAC